jgi:molybdopterin-biosynthesis enzyme MoeA-like protein
MSSPPAGSGRPKVTSQPTTPINTAPRALAILHEWVKTTGAAMTRCAPAHDAHPQGRRSHPQKGGVGGPGFWIGNVIVMMAGVPSIMQAMLDEVAPKLTIGVRMLSDTVRAGAREGDIEMQLGEIATANPAVEIGSYPFEALIRGLVYVRERREAAARAGRPMLSRTHQAQSATDQVSG